MKNSMEIKFKATLQNESFARSVVSGFIMPANPTLDDLNDIRTAVSEAYTNVIVHAYPDQVGYVTIKVSYTDTKVEICVADEGVGIQDIEKALTPFYTTRPEEERSGMGFTVMGSFMDKLEVKNKKNGVEVNMTKNLEVENL